jgi:hypothetical protein
MMEPSPEQIDRLHRLQKACLFVLTHCEAVEADWTRITRLQNALPEIASTMNMAMLAVMCIPTEDGDMEPR